MVAASGRAHAETEVEANGSVVQLRTIPLVVDGERAGALILLRDVTELRHRERELLTKDATIREIHHRVKNNLQTVAALLAAAGAQAARPGGQGGAGGGRPPGRLDRDGARDAVARAGRDRGLRRHRRAGWR